MRERIIKVTVTYDLDCPELIGLKITSKEIVKEMVERDMVEHFGWSEGYRGVEVEVVDMLDNIGCTSFNKLPPSDEEIRAALKQLEESESVVVNVRDKIHQDILSGKGLPKL